MQPTLAIIIGSSLFLGIMLPTILISSLPGLTIRLLKAFKLAGNNNLQSAKRDYIDGKGAFVNRRCYITVRNGVESLENGRVFGLLLMIFVPIMLIVGIIAYIILSKIYPL